MQAGARTPSSILRRRLDKENEDAAGRAAKRHKLANRRVSFAPDDELETKHIFMEDDRPSSRDMALASPTGVLPVEPPPSNLDAQSAAHHTAPMTMPDTPEDLSPLSMDLTNNSYERGRGGAVPPPAAGLLPLPLHNENAQPQLPHLSRQHHQAEFTRNITMNVPNLSTLVEEDEEEYAGGDASSAGDGDAFESSQPSPFVLREMQQCGGVSRQQQPSPLWNCVPGVEDTMEVKVSAHEHAGMGETTFNHVFASTTTGDVTRAIRDGITGGSQFGRLGPHTRSLAMGRKSTALADLAPPAAGILGADLPAQLAAAADNAAGLSFAVTAAAPSQAAAPGGFLDDSRVQLPARVVQLPAPPKPSPAPRPAPLEPLYTQDLLEQPVAQARQVQLQAPPAPGPMPPGVGFMDNTAKLLDDDQTDAWRLTTHGGAYDRRRLSVASNKVGGAGYRRTAAGLGGGGETTMLLGSHIHNHLGPDTVGAATVQLLAETTTQSAYERILGRVPQMVLPVPSVAPAARRGVQGSRGDVPAVSSNAGDPPRLSAHDTMDMSLELPIDQGNSMEGNDLLTEGGGLSLDAFAPPPQEPTIILMAAATGNKGGARLVPPPAPARAAAPPISCQDFLSLIDVSFNEKVCRTSYLPQSDPPPKTVGEVFEASAVTGCYTAVRQGNMVEVSLQLSSMQSRVQELETELTNHNPELFSEVQLASASQLETIKEQVIMLKKLCRIRTVRAIKQTELAALDDLLVQLEQSKGKLQAELNGMAADAEQLTSCVGEKEALVAAVARRVQEDDIQLQEAIQCKKSCETLYQRLQTLRLQNQESERRLEEKRAEKQAAEQTQVPMEHLHRERAALHERVGALAARSSASSALTPSREGQLVHQIAIKRDKAEALLALHALKVDLSRMERDRSFSLVFRNTFDLLVTSTTDGVCRAKVAQRDQVARSSGLPASVVAAVGTTAEALSCTVSRSELQLHIEVILQHLERMCSVTQQLQACYLEHNNMLRPQVETHGGAAGPATLVLGFTNVRTSTKVIIGMPWQAALSSDAIAPALRVQIRNLEAPEMQRQTCTALQETVLSKLEPGIRYLPALCYTMSATVG